MMHIALVGPFAGADLAGLLSPSDRLPVGYEGAPFMAVLARVLLAEGHRVTAITTDSGLPTEEPPFEAEFGRFRLIVCPSRPRAWRFNGARLGRALDQFRFEIAGLHRALRGVDADVVHAHWSYEFALASLRHSRDSIVTCHDSPRQVLRLTRSAYRAVRALMARRVFRLGRHFTTVSDYLARELASTYGIDAAVVPNPVADFVFEFGHARPLGETRRVALVSNGWNDLKNVKNGICGFQLWATDVPAAELHLFGHGYGAGQEAQRWVAESGLSQQGLHFHGPMAHTELIEACSRMDALLHPALEESFGVVIAEAMALGLPVIGGHESGAVPSVLGAGTDHPAGVLADVRSPPDLARALGDIFGPHYDCYSLNGTRRAKERYSAAAVVGQYLAQYALVNRQGQTMARGS